MMQSLDNLKFGKWLRLYHTLSPSTIGYGGRGGLGIKVIKSINLGDSCNQVHLSLSNHLGSHVDAPRHFSNDGLAVNDYPINDWFFYNPYLINVPVQEREILSVARFESVLKDCSGLDILLIRTGFENFRNEKKYWEQSPAFEPGLANYLSKRFSSLRAIGLDTISISSYQHRELGRQAHKAFLGSNIRIFEDLSLREVPIGQLKLVIGFPILFDQADGAPCTIVALV